jgi:hypothetical protein
LTVTSARAIHDLVDYSLEEVRVLKEILCAATGKERISFTADQRRRLALLGKKLSPEECIFRRHLGRDSDLTWARIPA